MISSACTPFTPTGLPASSVGAMIYLGRSVRRRLKSNVGLGSPGASFSRGVFLIRLTRVFDFPTKSPLVDASANPIAGQ